MMNSLIKQIQLEKYCKLISLRTGIKIRADECRTLSNYIIEKLRFFPFSNIESYFKILESDSLESQLEWKGLINSITIGESYFFRDKGQFSLLENRILPELIELRKNQRTLRIWSAGCSTGEEAYSLAILLDKLITERHTWEILILGTDINEDSIKKAEEGLYGQWSFRRVESGIKNRFFRKRNERWEIDRRFRNMVTFRTMNLIQERFPDAGTDLNNMDLILCRNLFIYFSKTAVSNVLKKLSKTLMEGGYLMTAHGELHDQELFSLAPMIFPESVIYRKQKKCSGIQMPECLTATMTLGRLNDIAQEDHRRNSTPENVMHTVSESSRHGDVNKMLTDISSLFGSDDSTRVSEKASSMLNTDPGNIDAAYFMAREYASRGLYDDALRELNQMLMRDSGQAGPYLILAQISEIRGDPDAAKDFLKKMIYLDPGSIAAHLELGAIYQREKDTVRATKMRTTALQLIKALPPETIIENYDGISAGELEGYVVKMLEDQQTWTEL